MYVYIIHVDTVVIRSVELRKQSGWYGDQPQECKRLNRTIAKDTLAVKTGYTVETISGPGIYIAVHKPTHQVYVGQAQNVGDRILQHICDATSFRDVAGKFDNLLRQSTDANQWEMIIKPCAEENLDKLELNIYSTLKDENFNLLNVRRPPKCK